LRRSWNISRHAWRRGGSTSRHPDAPLGGIGRVVAGGAESRRRLRAAGSGVSAGATRVHAGRLAGAGAADTTAIVGGDEKIIGLIKSSVIR